MRLPSLQVSIFGVWQRVDGGVNFGLDVSCVSGRTEFRILPYQIFEQVISSGWVFGMC